MNEDEIRRAYSQRFKYLQPIAQKLQAFIGDLLEEHDRVERITVRPKSIDRFVEKASRVEMGKPKYRHPLDDIQDQIGARITTYYLRDVKPIARIAERYFKSIEKKKISPKRDAEFGYFGEHYIFFVPRDVIGARARKYSPKFFELQVKTLFQHAWSEAEHDLGYKSPVKLTAEQRRKIAFTAAQVWGADVIFDDLYREQKRKGRNKKR